MHISGKRVLVTGASGFIGEHLCRQLLSLGATVYGISRGEYTAYDQSIQWRRGDLADVGVVRDLLSDIKPEVIFHLASEVLGYRDLKFVLPTFHNNLTSTVNLLTIATELGCQRIILAGSLEEPVAAEPYAIPCSPYSAAKWASSSYARMFLALYQTPVVIARLFMVYGPGQKDLNKLIPYVILSLLRRQAPKLSSGNRQVDWIYVDDVVDGLVATAEVPNIEGRTVDVGSGRLVTVRNIVELLCRLVGSEVKPQFGALLDRPMEQVRFADINKTYAEINWKPRTDLEEGLSRTIDWCRKISAAS
jgi:UDP-glucose 4-epimerase